jgi:hypothetical protein
VSAARPRHILGSDGEPLAYAVGRGGVLITAHHHAVLLSHERTLAGSGTDIRRLQKVNGSWKIARRWITDHVDFTIDVFHGLVEDPSKVDDLRRQADSSREAQPTNA